MKKQLLLLSVLAGMTMAGCSLGKLDTSIYDLVPEFSGGNNKEKKAILEAINNLSPVVNKQGGDLFSDEVNTLKEDNGDYVKVTTSQVYEKYTVKLEWSCDESQGTFLARDKSDNEHDIFSLKFPGYQGSQTTFNWKLVKASCGSCETAGDEVAEYSAKLKGYTHPHVETTIAALNAVTDGEQTIKGVTYPSTFDMVDYDKDSPYFKTVPGDPEPDYYYCSVVGKVIYYSEDGDWLLLANGKQVIEAFAGSARDLNPAGYPAIKKGAYVKLDGNMDQYQGNIQLSHVTKIVPASAEEKATVADPELYGTIDADFIKNTLKLDGYAYQKQAINGFSNSICQVTGTVKTAKTNAKPGSRFTFTLVVGDQELVVAYDYHTDLEGKLGLFDKLKTKIATAGTQVTLKGTMRYCGNDTNPFNQGSYKAVWNITPFEAADVQ